MSVPLTQSSGGDPQLTPFLAGLIELFYNAPDELAGFQAVPRPDTPQPYQELLVHEHHMTVTVERFFGSLVDVKVLARQTEGDDYSRKILLSRQSDGQIVQFGLVRLKLHFLDPLVRARILSEEIPLGRVLIEHNVLRRIHLLSIWKITPGQELTELFGLSEPQVTYGRTAILYCDHEPAIELLEVVRPAGTG